MSKLKKFLKYFFLSLKYKRVNTTPYLFDNNDFISFINSKERSFNDFNKTIWMYWDGTTIPLLVQKCIDRIKLMNGGFEIILLNDKNINEYLPDLKFEVLDIPIANKTDVMRLELLYKYGGIWMDATIIVFENLDWVFSVLEQSVYDCIAFRREKSTIYSKYPVIESWFLCCPPKSPFIKAWLDELKPICQLGSGKYFEKIKQRSDYTEIVQNIERPEYLLVYLAQQIAMQKYNDFNVFLLSSEKTAFFYQEACNWDIRKMYVELMFKKVHGDTPLMIKLISGNSADVDYCYRNDFINKDSIVGNLFYKTN